MFDRLPPLDPASETPFWLFGTVAERLETVLSVTPSATTWRALEAIGACTTAPAERVLLAAAWDRQLNAASALMHRAVAQATTPSPDAPLGDLDAEVGLMLRRSEAGAQALVRFSHRLVDDFPVMTDLLLSGRVGIAYARAIDDLVFGLTPEQVAQIDAEMSPRSAKLTLPAFRRAVSRAVAALDPDNARKRAERARKERSGARMRKEPDGMATVSITMPAPSAVEAMGALHRRADEIRTDDDPRTHGERQVDALLDALAGSQAAPGADDGGARPGTRRGRHGRRRAAEIVVFVDLLTLLGLREGAGELVGYGPIPADQVRAMLADEGTVLRRLVHDPETGAVTDYSQTTYSPDETLRSLVSVRDVTCRYPGCTRNAAWCDVEHAVPFDEGGETSCANCGLMCRRHHRRKTHDGFRYRRTDFATGETLWETPLGFLYRQGGAVYYRSGRDTGDTERLRAPADVKTRYDAEDDPPPF